MNRSLAFLLITAAMGMSGCASTGGTASARLHNVQHVDLDRYMGRWYVIANIPNFFEKGKVGTSDNYARRADGRLDNVFAFHKGSLDAPEKRWEGVAWVTDSTSNAQWKVRLFWPLTADYRVLELDPDYRWAVVSNGDGKMLWVLARDTSLPENVYQEILGRITAQGLDPSQLVKVPQRGSPSSS